MQLHYLQEQQEQRFITQPMAKNQQKTSNVYSEPITVNEAVTIKAMAVKEGLTNSPVSTFDL